jgi:hypothetical protein
MGEWKIISTILDLDTDGGEYSTSRPGRFTPGENRIVHVKIIKKLN